MKKTPLGIFWLFARFGRSWKSYVRYVADSVSSVESDRFGFMDILSALHLFNWKEAKQELTKPPLLSGMATFPMAGMILSTYVFRVFPHLPLVAQGLWWFSFLLDVALIAGFTIKFACPGRRVHATPSWTVLYVGIAVAALTYPLVGIIEIAYATFEFWISLDLLSLSAYL